MQHIYMHPKTISLHSVWPRQVKRLDTHVLYQTMIYSWDFNMVPVKIDRDIYSALNRCE